MAERFELLFIDDEFHERILYGHSSFDKEVDEIRKADGLPVFAECPACFMPRGMCHRLGCDAERCPICDGQLISCGCWVGE